MPRPLSLPLARWAEGELRAMGMPAALSGTMLMGERAALNGFAVPGEMSAGGGCRLYATRDGHVALTLARHDDRAMLPALFQDGELDPDDEAQIVATFRAHDGATLVAQGRMLGLAIARLGEVPVSPPCQVTAEGALKARTRPLLVIDLSALWAGPLAAHLIGLTGAQVVKVESRNRPDRMREGDPALFARINQDKDNVALDLREDADREALVALICQADVVIEAARPRALRQLGIHADALVRAVPGLVWMTITGHGATGDAGDWIGFGDDASVAGGLSDALFTASGRVGFGGDACADPLTGIHAARLALEQVRDGRGARMILSMSAIVAMALDSERRRDEKALMVDLQAWGAAQWEAFPVTDMRPAGCVAAMGQDNDVWLVRC